MKITKSKLKEIIKQELTEYEKGTPEDVGESLVDVILDLQLAVKRIDFKKVRNWSRKYHRSAPGLLDMITRTLTIFGKIK